MKMVDLILVNSEKIAKINPLKKYLLYGNGFLLNLQFTCFEIHVHVCLDISHQERMHSCSQLMQNF